MSALLVDDLVVAAPTRPQPSRWRHVERAPQARPQSPRRPGGRPDGVAAPQLRQAPVRPVVMPARDSWQLTDRGLAVVMVLFLTVVVVAAVVLVGAFFSVSDAPIPTAATAGVSAAVQG